MAAAQPILEQRYAPFKRIGIATDFSEISRRAVPYGVALARQYGSQVYFIHALPDLSRESIPVESVPRHLDLYRQEAEEQMQKFVDGANLLGLNSRPFFEDGPPAEILTAIVERQGVDLVVLATHGRGGVKKLVMGSVAEEALRLLRCPVLVVGPQVTPEEKPVFERILFATDFGPGAAKALPFALELAGQYEAKLIMLHMMPPLTGFEAGPAAYGPASYVADEIAGWEAKKKQECLTKLKTMIPSKVHLATEPDYVIGTAAPAKGILKTAEEHAVDLIVVGANRTYSPRTSAHMPWAVAHQVICNAKCPVLTVRSG